MSLNSKYWVLAMLLELITGIYLFLTFWNLGYTENMPFMSEQRLFLASFIGTGFILGALFYILYEIWDRHISWRVRLF